MNIKGRDLVTIDDLSNEEIEAVFSLADEMSESIYSQTDICRGKIMASLFFEPSTRTRLSFEAAMHRLGGSVISAMDVNATSLAKGESIADMARVIGSYADIMVLRHPWEGAAKVAADYAGIPVINAGDGSHEHPTQTLCDLFTIKKEKKSLSGLKVALCGDLKYGRTIHSLTCALARLGAIIIFCPAPGVGMPDHVIKKITAEYGGELRKIDAGDLSPLAQDNAELTSPELDAVYITPTIPHQPALLTDFGIQTIRIDLKEGVDALYVTRLQKERFAATKDDGEIKKPYPVVDKNILKGKEFKSTLVMHPLPRVDELAYELDTDPRSIYFKQAARGVPVRMALIALLLGGKEGKNPDREIYSPQKPRYPIYKPEFGVKCHNPKCVSVNESRYIKPEFEIIDKEPLTLRCLYCERETHPSFIASLKWHQGTSDQKCFYKAERFRIEKIKSDNLLIFDTEDDALAQGFKPGKSVLKGQQ